MPDFPTIPYNPADWYWYVAGDETRPYSSKAGDYVAPDAPAYAAWRAAGNLPSRILNVAELGEVLADARVRPTNAALLRGFKKAHAGKMTLEIAAKVMFAMWNELRAVRGEEPGTPAQFRDYVEEVM
mgnify:CR=1 FL=1